MSNDDPQSKDPKPFPESPSKRATSIGPSRGSELSGAGSPLDRPIARHTTGTSGDKAFDLALVERLLANKGFRLAKVMFTDNPDVQVCAVTKDWRAEAPRTIRLLRFWAVYLDPIPMPSHGSYRLIGIQTETPMDNIRGFMWVAPEDEPEYLQRFSNETVEH